MARYQGTVEYDDEADAWFLVTSIPGDDDFTTFDVPIGAPAGTKAKADDKAAKK
jgi:hypothetical protein